MKYIRKTSYDIRQDFLRSLLIDRDIIQDDEEFNYKFFNPTKDNELSPSLLDNISNAADMIEYHIKNNNKIYIIVD